LHLVGFSFFTLWSVTAKRYSSPHGLSIVWQVDKKAFGGTYCLYLRVTRVSRGQ